MVIVLLGLVLQPSAALASPGAATPLFEIHCAGCHPGGGNIVRRGKSLQARALKRHGYDTQTAMIDIITQGKGLMSAYGDRLTPEQIEALATYVLKQAEAGWHD